MLTLLVIEFLIFIMIIKMKLHEKIILCSVDVMLAILVIEFAAMITIEANICWTICHAK